MLSSCGHLNSIVGEWLNGSKCAKDDVEKLCRIQRNKLSAFSERTKNWGEAREAMVVRREPGVDVCY